MLSALSTISTIWKYADRNFIRNLILWARLILRLMLDRRVNLFLKLIPVASVAYFLLPVDIVLLPLSDVVVLSLGMVLFVELCPPQVVQEHMNELKNVKPAEWPEAAGSGQVIDIK